MDKAASEKSIGCQKKGSVSTSDKSGRFRLNLRWVLGFPISDFRFALHTAQRFFISFKSRQQLWARTRTRSADFCRLHVTIADMVVGW